MYVGKRIFIIFVGFFAGIISGLLGAGGGLIVVPSLMKSGLKQQYAHAASVFIMLPICIVGSLMYMKSDAVNISHAINYIPSGIIGAIIGSLILSKINHTALRKIFGCFSIWAACRMLIK